MQVRVGHRINLFCLIAIMFAFAQMILKTL